MKYWVVSGRKVVAQQGEGYYKSSSHTILGILCRIISVLGIFCFGARNVPLSSYGNTVANEYLNQWDLPTRLGHLDYLFGN